jgi:hypothetical protein
MRHEAGVIAQTVEPKGLAHIAVDRSHATSILALEAERLRNRPAIVKDDIEKSDNESLRQFRYFLATAEARQVS